VIIPAHNSERRIRGVLANLAAQPLPEEVRLRVLVCANACRDDTAGQASLGLDALCEARRGTETRLIETEVSGQANALNVLVQAAGEPGVVIELQDDVYPSKGALVNLVAAMAERPDLGAVSVTNMPIPEHKGRDGSWCAKVAYRLRTKDNFSKTGLVDRFAAFRPKVIGKFPDLVSVDCFMAMRSLDQAGGYGVIQPEVAEVFYRLPKTMGDLLDQQDMYVKGTLQARQWWRNNVRPVHEDLRKNKLKAAMDGMMKTMADKELSLDEKLGVVALIFYGRLVSRLKNRLDPYRSGVRSRIWSSV